MPPGHPLFNVWLNACSQGFESLVVDYLEAFKVMVECIVTEKIHTHSMKGHWKFLGGGGVLKAKFLKPLYENKLEFPEGRGGEGGAKQKKKGSVGIVWIFSGTAQSCFLEHPREMKIGSKNPVLQEIGGKITGKFIEGKRNCFDKLQRLRNGDSVVF